MANYRILFRSSVYKDLKPIPAKAVQRIMQRIDLLQTDPRPPGCEKLTGHERYRLRAGIYRILYEIQDTALIITVVKGGSGTAARPVRRSGVSREKQGG